MMEPPNDIAKKKEYDFQYADCSKILQQQKIEKVRIADNKTEKEEDLILPPKLRSIAGRNGIKNCESKTKIEFPNLFSNKKNSMSSSSKEKDPLDLDDSPNQCIEAWTKYPFACNLCNAGPLHGYESLHAHFTQEHKSSMRHIHFLCNFCGTTIFFYSVFLNHVRLNHKNDWKHCCDICDKYFEDYAELSEHRDMHKLCIKTVHPDCYFCFKCGRAYSNEPELNNHIQLSHSHKCIYCKKLFSSRAQMEEHMASSHNLICADCKKVFLDFEKYKEHCKLHHSIEYSCEFCMKKFQSLPSLNSHKKKHYNPVIFKCDYCAEEFPRRREKAQHERIHTGFTVYSCKQCCMDFATEEKWQEHKSSIHIWLYNEKTGGDSLPTCAKRPFECDYCDKCYKSIYDLKAHKRKHHGIRSRAKERFCIITGET